MSEEKDTTKDNILTNEEVIDTPPPSEVKERRKPNTGGNRIYREYKNRLPSVHRYCKEDNKNTPETERRVFEVVDLIVKGKTKETCLKYVMDKYNIAKQMANEYYIASIEYLLPKDVDKHRKQLIEKNLVRLEKIVEKTMDRENYRDAINAIKEINRVINPNNNTVEVATKDTAFKVTFNNN